MSEKTSIPALQTPSRGDLRPRCALPKAEWQLRSAIRGFGLPAPDSAGLRAILAALGTTPLTVFRHHIRQIRKTSPDLDIWIETARTAALVWRQSRASSQINKERLIATPFAQRFPQPADAARLEASLSGKVSSDVQALVVRSILERSFTTDPASWVKLNLDELAWRSGFSRQSLELAAWLAAIAGLIERKRSDGVWRYTVVPECWDRLPNYDRECTAIEGVA